MSRLNKKTRIKRLPPVLELQRQDSTTGSYPTTVRFSSDGRTGKYPVFYNDTSTLNFKYLSGSIPGAANLLPYIYAYYPINNQTTSSTTVFPPSYATASSGLPLSSLTFVLSGNAPSYIRFENGNAPYSSSLTQSSVYVSGGWDFSIGGTGDLRFVPRSGALSITSSTAFDFSSGAFSFTCWMKRKYAGSNTDIVAYRSHVSGYQFLLSVSQAFSVGLMPNYNFLNTVGVNKTADFGGGNISDGNWHFIGFSYDGNNFDLSANDQNRLNLYFDGQNMGGTFSNSKVTGSAMSGGIGDIKIGAGFESGSIAHFAFWKKQLTDDEIYRVYLDTSNFVSLSAGATLTGSGLNYGSGLPTGNRYGDSENTSSLNGSGFVRKGIGDSLVHFTPGQYIKPFVENHLLEVDAKSSMSSSFYTTGSSLIDFDDPLWDKQKIMIDLTPSSSQTFAINYVSASYPTVYWNFARNQWEGIGPSQSFAYYIGINSGAFINGATYNFRREKAIATAPSVFYDIALTPYENIGKPIEEFGFPYAQKFHATSSQTFDLSNYIDRPFLVEKFVFEFCGAVSGGVGSIYNLPGGGSTYDVAPVANNLSFMLLVQKPNNMINGTIEDSTPFTRYTGSYSTINSNRTIINVVNIAGVNQGQYPGLNLLVTSGVDYQFIGSDFYSGSFWNTTTSSIMITGSFRYNGGTITSSYLTTRNYHIVPNNTDDGFYTAISHEDFGFKHDRNYVNPSLDLGIKTGDSTYQYQSNYPKTPYLFMPTDKIVLGVALPYTDKIYRWTNPSGALDNSDSSMVANTYITFSSASRSRLVLYGSYVENGKEYNESTNQLLSSNTIHEVIG